MDKLIQKLEENGIVVGSVEQLCESVRAMGYDPESLNAGQISKIISELLRAADRSNALPGSAGDMVPSPGGTPRRGRKATNLNVDREQMPSDFKHLKDLTDGSVKNIAEFEKGFHEGLDEVVAVPVNRMLSRATNLDVEVVQSVIAGAAQLGGDKDPALFRSAGRDVALAALLGVSNPEADTVA